MNAAEQPSDLDLRDEVLAWCVRRGCKDWSTAEETAFQTWLSAAPARRQAFDQWQAYNKTLDSIPTEAVAALRSRLAIDKAKESAHTDVPPVRRTTMSAVSLANAPRRRLVPLFVTAAVLVMVSSSALLAWNHWQAQPVYMQAFSTQRGQQIEAQLPDGSRLRLDTATRLEVTYYRQRREVTLFDGQAFFSVQPNAERPFQVLAGPMGVTVVGTRFTVRYTPTLPGADGMHVAVEEGKVHVARRDDLPGMYAPKNATGVNLTAGQQVTANAQGVIAHVGTVPSEDVAPWRTNRISFVDTPLDQALAEFERYTDTGLVVHDPTTAGLRLSGTFDPRDVQTLRRVLPSALPVRLKSSGDTTEIVLTD
jgi:transmembrane sensor